jgi:hypothetical protein
MQENSSKTTEAAHGVELRSLQNELSKLTAELSSKEQLVEAQLAEQNKPLLERVNEVKGMAEALGISSDDKQPLPQLQDNSPLHEKLLTLLVSQADKLLPQLTALIKKDKPEDGASELPASMMPQQQQAKQMMGGPTRALPPKRPQRMTFADSDGPPLRSYEDLPSPDAPSEKELEEMPATSYAAHAPRPYAPPNMGSAIPQADSQQMMQQIQYEQQMMQQQQMRPASPQPMPSQPPPPQMQPQMQPRPQQPHREQPIQKPSMQMGATPQGASVKASGPEEKPWENFAWIPGVSEQDLIGLTSTLVQACQHKIEPPDLVKMFIEQHGKETISMLPAMIDEDKFIASIRVDVATRETILATGKGKRYLKDVWACIKEQTAEEAAEEKQTEQKEESSEESEKQSEEQG